jgi:ComF family protein
VPFVDFALGDRVPDDMAVVPVPLHPSKHRERGYNQSKLLGEGLCRRRGFHLADVLTKTRATPSQTTLEKLRRTGNVTGSIALRSSGPLSIEKVLIVDDVVTTGSTLRECARALLAVGVKEIDACAVAASL